MFKYTFIIMLMFSLINTLQATSKKIIDIGDILYTGLILHAYGTTYKDREAFLPLTYHTIATLGTGYILKGVVNEKRPDYKPGDHKDSFPSGHSFSSFIAPTYIHQRYGFKQAIPTYLLASFVGYTRVAAKRHYIHDVVAGAAIAYASSLIFINPETKYITGSITPTAFNLTLTLKY